MVTSRNARGLPNQRDRSLQATLSPQTTLLPLCAERAERRPAAPRSVSSSKRSVRKQLWIMLFFCARLPKQRSLLQAVGPVGTYCVFSYVCVSKNSNMRIYKNTISANRLLKQRDKEPCLPKLAMGANTAAADPAGPQLNKSAELNLPL